ncbi:MAG: hypothetical protein ACLR2E_02815 [Lachnospiraceae bacterium]
MKHKIRSCFALLLAVSTLITSVPAGVFASEPAVTMEEESSTSGAEEETYDFSETKAKETESDEEATFGRNRKRIGNRRKYGGADGGMGFC